MKEILAEEDTFDELKYKIIRSNDFTKYLDCNGEIHRDDDKPVIVAVTGKLT